MRIGIDASLSSYELRGMGKYVLQLVLGVVSGTESDQYVVYGDPKVFPSLAGRANVRFRRPGGLPFPVWEQVVLPVWARQDRLDLLHCPVNTAPVALASTIKLVLTIHDVMYLLPPSVLSSSSVFRQRLGNFYRKVIVPRVSRRASRVITVSEYSKREIVAYLKTSPDLIRVVHEGIDANFKNLADGITLPPIEFGTEILDSPFILVLGAGDPRKNTLAVIRAYAACWRDLPNQEKLVIVGMRDWRTSATYRLARELNLGDAVLFNGYVSEPTLAWLYSSARCFLYPTLYEGFGFPPLEAMACGTPVITSDCTSVSEIVGDAAIFVDPTSDEAISKALVTLLQDEPLRLRLIERGRARIQKFTWQNTVQKTLDVYAELNEIGNP